MDEGRCDRARNHAARELVVGEHDVPEPELFDRPGSGGRGDLRARDEATVGTAKADVPPAPVPPKFVPPELVPPTEPIPASPKAPPTPLTSVPPVALAPPFSWRCSTVPLHAAPSAIRMKGPP